jgi:hypothetical protein
VDAPDVLERQIAVAEALCQRVELASHDVEREAEFPGYFLVAGRRHSLAVAEQRLAERPQHALLLFGIRPDRPQAALGKRDVRIPVARITEGQRRVPDGDVVAVA